jgi:hypothetical protein
MANIHAIKMSHFRIQAHCLVAQKVNARPKLAKELAYLNTKKQENSCKFKRLIKNNKHQAKYNLVYVYLSR